MLKTISLITALTVFATLPANTAAAANVAEANVAELLTEEHYSEAGYEVDLYVTRTADGGLLSEATIIDPASGNEVDVWTNGATIWWDGVIDGERVNGSVPTPDVTTEDPPPPPEPICFTPITAIICLGALIVATGFAGCAHGKSICRTEDSPQVPGGAGGVPPEDDGGGDGDGDGDGNGSGGAGGDED